MKRKNRCGNCDGCLTPNCVSCLHCRDMIKFGGRGKMKQACINRVCLTRNLEEDSAKKNTKGRKRNDRSSRSKGSHGCDQCERQFHQKNDLEAHLLTHAKQNSLKCTDDANSQDEKVKIEKNYIKGYKSSIGEMCSNRNLMAPSEKMFLNNNDCGVTNKSMLEDGTVIEKSPEVAILSEKVKVRISKKQFSKTKGISLSDVEMSLRGMSSESSVKANETSVGFNEVKNPIKKNKTKVQFDEVTVISDDDTDLTSKSLDLSYSGRIGECFIKVEVLKNAEGLKYQDNKDDSENNANKGCNSSKYIRTHDHPEKILNGDLMTKSGNSLEINNVAKISQKSVNEALKNRNGSSKTSVITKKQHIFETPEKKITTKVSSIGIVGKNERSKSENIIRKNKISIESTDTAAIVLDDDLDKSDQPKEECSESYSVPIRTNYSTEVKEIKAQELVQDETGQPEEVLTFKKQDNGIPRKSKQSTNKENISNASSIFEVNGNIRIPAVTFLNTQKKHCEGVARKNKIIETDNVYDMKREVAEMSESSTTSDEDGISDQSEDLIDQSEKEEHFDRHSNLSLSVPIPSFSHPLLSLARSPARPIPLTKCASQRGGEHMDSIAVEDAQSRCPRFQENCAYTFEDMTTSDFESPPIDDRSIEDIFEDFIKRKSTYISF